MNVFLTGSGGFSGSHIYNHLFNTRSDICLKTLPGLDLSTDSWKGITWDFNLDAIIHTAAVSPNEGVSTSDLIRNINITKSVIRIAQLAKAKKIIYFSSTSRYGDISVSTLTRNTPVVDPSVYGMTKLISEELLKESGIPTVSLQLPLIIGKGCKRNWIARMQEAVKRGDGVAAYNPDTLFNNAVHIDFLCQIIETLLGTTIDGFKPMLMGSIGSMPIREMVEKIVHDRVPITWIYDTLKHGHLIEHDLWFVYPEVEPWTIEKTIDKYVKDER